MGEAILHHATPERVNFKNCCWLMSHFFPEYGRFVFSTENLIKSLFCGHLGQPKVKCQNQGYLPILSNLSQKSLTFRKKVDIFFDLIVKLCIHWAPPFLKCSKLSLVQFLSHLEAKQSHFMQWNKLQKFWISLILTFDFWLP